MKKLFRNKTKTKTRPQRDPRMEFETRDTEGGSLNEKYLLMLKK